jgi:Arc/MetJ family transcription regulator
MAWLSVSLSAQPGAGAVGTDACLRDSGPPRCAANTPSVHITRTNIEIDDKLMSDTLRLTGLKTKKEAVELGLRTLLRLRQIDFFRGQMTPQTERLDSLLSTEPLAVGDLILAEVLQGFSSEKDFNQATRRDVTPNQ